MLKTVKKHKPSGLLYEVHLAESLDDCLQLVGGNEQALIRCFNRGWSVSRQQEFSRQHQPKDKIVAAALKRLSPEVREVLEGKTAEEKYELIQKAKERLERQQAGEPD